MPESDSDVSSVFTEKIWGKEIDGEYITDGYSFRGKRVFSKALNGFKEMMKKGVDGKVNNVDFKVLDNRKIGTELNIEIEVTENENRGIAILKLYGPNKQKEYTVLISKSKQSESKYVTILAKQVIQPLIMKFLTSQTLSFCSW